MLTARPRLSPSRSPRRRRGPRPQVDEELTVPGGAGELRRHSVDQPKPKALRCGHNPRHGPPPDGRIPHHAALAHCITAGFELGFHEEQEIGIGRRYACQSLEDGRQRDKGEIRNHAIGLERKLVTRHQPDVRALEDRDPIVVPDLPVELSIADIDCRNVAWPPVPTSSG